MILCWVTLCAIPKNGGQIGGAMMMLLFGLARRTSDRVTLAR